MRCLSRKAMRQEHLEEEVRWLQGMLAREQQGKQAALCQLQDERAKNAILELEILHAARAAKEMGESLCMFFNPCFQQPDQQQQLAHAARHGRDRRGEVVGVVDDNDAATTNTSVQRQELGVEEQQAGEVQQQLLMLTPPPPPLEPVHAHTPDAQPLPQQEQGQKHQPVPQQQEQDAPSDPDTEGHDQTPPRVRESMAVYNSIEQWFTPHDGSFCSPGRAFKASPGRRNSPRRLARGSPCRSLQLSSGSPMKPVSAVAAAAAKDHISCKVQQAAGPTSSLTSAAATAEHAQATTLGDEPQASARSTLAETQRSSEGSASVPGVAGFGSPFSAVAAAAAAAQASLSAASAALAAAEAARSGSSSSSNSSLFEGASHMLPASIVDAEAGYAPAAPAAAAVNSPGAAAAAATAADTNAAVRQQQQEEECQDDQMSEASFRRAPSTAFSADLPGPPATPPAAVLEASCIPAAVAAAAAADGSSFSDLDTRSTVANNNNSNSAGSGGGGSAQSAAGVAAEPAALPSVADKGKPLLLQQQQASGQAAAPAARPWQAPRKLPHAPAASMTQHRLSHSSNGGPSVHHHPGPVLSQQHQQQQHCHVGAGSIRPAARHSSSITGATPWPHASAAAATAAHVDSSSWGSQRYYQQLQQPTHSAGAARQQPVSGSRHRTATAAAAAPSRPAGFAAPRRAEPAAKSQAAVAVPSLCLHHDQQRRRLSSNAASVAGLTSLSPLHWHQFNLGSSSQRFHEAVMLAACSSRSDVTRQQLAFEQTDTSREAWVAAATSRRQQQQAQPALRAAGAAGRAHTMSGGGQPRSGWKALF